MLHFLFSTGRKSPIAISSKVCTTKKKCVWDKTRLLWAQSHLKHPLSPLLVFKMRLNMKLKQFLSPTDRNLVFRKVPARIGNVARVYCHSTSHERSQVNQPILPSLLLNHSKDSLHILHSCLKIQPCGSWPQIPDQVAGGCVFLERFYEWIFFMSYSANGTITLVRHLSISSAWISRVQSRSRLIIFLQQNWLASLNCFEY